MKWTAMVIAGVTLASEVVAGQAPPRKPVAARIACSPAPGRPGSREWMRRHGALLAPEKQEALPLGRLVGVVRDPGGVGLPNAFVQLQSGPLPGDTAGARHAITDRNGAFAFDSLEHRGFILRVAAVGMLKQWQELWGIRGYTDTLCIVLRPLPNPLGPVFTSPVRKDTALRRR